MAANHCQRSRFLLTFDDGYKSYRTRVLPILELFGFPSVLAPVTSWIDTPKDQPVDYGGELRPRENFLDWQDMQEISKTGLVEVLSHSHDLHRGILANSYGNLQPRAKTFAYVDAQKRYESEAEFSARVGDDLERSINVLRKHEQDAYPAIVWPYGAYSDLSNKVAHDVGLTEYLTLDDKPNVRGKRGIHRHLISNKTDLASLRQIALGTSLEAAVRAVHIDLDYVFDEDETQFVKNLDLLIDRVNRMRVNTVFLQAFADPDGNGVADALYFPNRHLPVRKDIFNRVAWQLQTRAGVGVYAWMPILAFELPDQNLNQRLAVVASNGSHKTRYHRLSPFNPVARKIIHEIYQDLGRSVAFTGVLFHDDGFLTDFEDVSVAALKYVEDKGVTKLAAQDKTTFLIDFTMDLAVTLRAWQPDLKTARNIYAEVVLNPSSESWWAQNYGAFTEHYDYAAVMAMPYLERAKDPSRWLDGLVRTMRTTDPDFNKTLFHMQTVDCATGERIPGRVLAEQFTQIMLAGARHIAYYPDDFFNNHPSLQTVRKHLSINDFPALKGEEPVND